LRTPRSRLSAGPVLPSAARDPRPGAGLLAGSRIPRCAREDRPGTPKQHGPGKTKSPRAHRFSSGREARRPMTDGSSMVKVSAFESPPPGPGLTTVTEAKPPVAMSRPVTEAVSWVALMKVVGRTSPFQRTVALGTKPLPPTVREKALP